VSVQTDIGVRVGADLGPLQRDLKKAGSTLESFGKDARTKLDAAAKAIAASMGAAVVAVTAIGVKSAASAKELRSLAMVADTSVSSFQRMAYGAKSVGIEQDKLADILKDVKDRVGDFITTGGGPMADFFEKIAPRVGVTAEQFRKLSGPQALQLFVSSLEKANISQAEFTFYMEAMASDSTKLLPLLMENGKGFAEMSEKADKLGIILSEIETAKLAKMGEDVDTLTSGFSTLTEKLAAKFAPAVSEIVKKLLEAIESAGGMNSVVNKVFKSMINSASFVIDAIDGIKRAFAVTADAIIVAMMAIAKDIASSFEYVLTLISKLPGVDYSETIQSIKDFKLEAEGVMLEAASNIDEILMAPMAGDKFRKFINDAQQAGQAAAEAAAQARDSIVSSGSGQTQSSSEQDDEAAKKAAKKAEDAAAADAKDKADKLQSLRDYFKSELELIEDQNKAKLDQIDYFEKENLLKDGEAANMSEAQRQKHAEAIASIHEAENANTVTSTADMWGQLEGLSTSRSRKLFEIGKAVALANAAIKAPEAIINSYAHGTKIGGPPVGAAFAAVAAATTANMIRNIRSQSFGSQGAGATTAAGGSGGGQAMAASASQEQRQAPLEVRMSGLDAGSMFSGQMISTMFDRLRDEAGDRGVRFIA
jgi:hypothetical protein